MNKPVTLYLLLCIIFIFNYIHGATLPAFISTDSEGANIYITWIYIGNPEVLLKLEVSFDEDDLIIFKDLQTKSYTWDTRDGFRDVIYFSDKAYKIDFILTSPSLVNRKCLTCDGIFPLGKNSDIWKFFPYISFTKGSIHLNEISSLYQSKSQKPFIIQCKNENYSLCSFDGIVSFSNKKWDVPIVIVPELEYIILPNEIYFDYMDGKNIYSYDKENWPLIEITPIINELLSQDFLNNIKSRGFSIENNQKISLKTHKQVAGVVETLPLLLIKSHDEDYVRIGSSLWNHYILYKDSIYNVAIYQSHTTSVNLSTTNVILVVILFYLLIRYVNTDATKLLYPTKSNMYYHQISNTLDLCTIVISIVLFWLDENQDILSGTPWLLYSVGIFLLVSVVLHIIIMLYHMFYYVSFEDKQDEDIKDVNVLKDKFRINIVRNVLFRFISITGIWIGLLGVQTDGVSTISSIILNFYLIFSMSYYLVHMLIYYILFDDLTDGNVPIWFIIFSFIIAPGFYGFEVFITFYEFALPFLKMNAQIYTDVIGSIIAIIYLLCIIGATMLSEKYLQHSFFKMKGLSEFEFIEKSQIKYPITYSKKLSSQEIVKPDIYYSRKTLTHRKTSFISEKEKKVILSCINKPK